MHVHRASTGKVLSCNGKVTWLIRGVPNNKPKTLFQIPVVYAGAFGYEAFASDPVKIIKVLISDFFFVFCLYFLIYITECIAKADAFKPVGPNHSSPQNEDPYLITQCLDQPCVSAGKLSIKAYAEKPTNKVIHNCVVSL